MAKSESPVIYAVRHGAALYGEFEMDRKAIEELPNERIRITVSTGRSPSRLRWYWSFLRDVVEATECAPDTESLHSLIKLETGYTTPVKLKGYNVLVPRSVSFSSMDETTFSRFCDQAVKFIAETYGVYPEDKGK